MTSLSTSRHGVRRSPNIETAGAVLRLSETLRQPGKPRRVDLVVDEGCDQTLCDCGAAVEVPLRARIRLDEEKLLLLAHFAAEHAEAPTVLEHVRPQDLRLGDVVVDLFAHGEVMVVGLGEGLDDSTVVDYRLTASGPVGSFIARHGSIEFSVRLPRPPAERRHPEEVGS